MCKHHPQVYINSVKCHKRSMKLSGKNANCFKFCYLVSKIQIRLLTNSCLICRDMDFFHLLDFLLYNFLQYFLSFFGTYFIIIDKNEG